MKIAMKFLNLKSWAILCALYMVQETSCQIQGACKHNQFRCSDGSKCLATEKLCNGAKDCPRGEDERGSKQWDCSKTTLSTSCNPETEYKCRYGGCISRTEVCDGKPDCWGGNDEATDVCVVKRTTPRPRPPSATSRPPQQRPTVPQVAPPQQSRPPSPPPSQGVCPPIIEDPTLGFEISCFNEYNKPMDCTSQNVPLGTSARYRCKKYYNPPSTGSPQTERVCQQGGQWTNRRKTFSCSLRCGDGGHESVALITGGITSKIGKWPWHVALYQEDPPNSGKFEFFCGGSLVSSRAVLTAAHCVTKKSTSVQRNPREIRVVLGKYYRPYAKRDQNQQDRLVREINVFDSYNHYNLDDDIAIVWLDKPAMITDRVRPICLPTDSDSDIYGYGSSNLGQLVGWGRASNGKFKDELQEAKIPIVSPTDCKKAHPTFTTLVRRTTFCAGYRNGTSACDGDSGGSLIFPDPENGRTWRVHGIVSAGIAKSTGGCQENYYSVFTRVDKYLNWINGKLDREYRR